MVSILTAAAVQGPATVAYEGTLTGNGADVPIVGGVSQGTLRTHHVPFINGTVTLDLGKSTLGSKAWVTLHGVPGNPRFHAGDEWAWHGHARNVTVTLLPGAPAMVEVPYRLVVRVSP